MMIRLKLKFCPNQANPARTSGKGVYRVVRSYEAAHSKLPSIAVLHYYEGGWDRFLYMTADRHYKPGSRVNPLKIALAAVERHLDAYTQAYGRIVRPGGNTGRAIHTIKWPPSR
jgi:hypothetical protein